MCRIRRVRRASWRAAFDVEMLHKYELYKYYIILTSSLEQAASPRAGVFPLSERFPPERASSPERAFPAERASSP